MTKIPSVLFIALTLFFAAPQLRAQVVPPQSYFQQQAIDKKVEEGKKKVGEAYYEIQKKTGTSDNAWKTDQRNNASAAGPRSVAGNDYDSSTWVGQWVRVECVEVGGAVGIGCVSQPASGPLRIEMTDYKSGIGGTLNLGTLDVTFSGIKDADGKVSASGYGREAATDITITNWSGTHAGATMTGSFTLTYHPDETALGPVIVRVAIQDMKEFDPDVAAR